MKIATPVPAKTSAPSSPSPPPPPPAPPVPPPPLTVKPSPLAPPVTPPPPPPRRGLNRLAVTALAALLFSLLSHALNGGGGGGTWDMDDLPKLIMGERDE